jgi:hypothetical protein
VPGRDERGMCEEIKRQTSRRDEARRVERRKRRGRRRREVGIYGIYEVDRNIGSLRGTKKKSNSVPVFLHHQKVVGPFWRRDPQTFLQTPNQKR